MADAAKQTDEMARAAAGLAGQLADVDMSASSMWKEIVNTAQAAGASKEDIIRLAESLGIADSTQVQAQLTFNDLMTSWTDGTSTVTELGMVMSHLDEYQRLADESSNLLKDGETEAAEAARIAAIAHLELAGNIMTNKQSTDELTEAYERVPTKIWTDVEQPNMPEAKQNAADYLMELGRIPGSVDTTVNLPIEDATQVAEDYLLMLGRIPGSLDTFVTMPDVEQTSESASEYKGILDETPTGVETTITQPNMPQGTQAATTYKELLTTTPTAVSTAISQPNMPESIQSASQYKGILDSIPTSITTTVTTNYVSTGDSGGGGGTGGAEDEYAAGTNYVPFTGPAILHQGEMVIPAAQAANMRRGGSGGMIVLAPIIMDAGAYTDATGSVAYSDIGSLVLQRLEGVM